MELNMRQQILAFVLGLALLPGAFADTSYQESADIIKETYETQLYTLSAFKAGHYGLRMYRQTLDDKYAAAVWSDMARVASRLNRFAAEVHTPEQILLHSEKRIAGYFQWNRWTQC